MLTTEEIGKAGEDAAVAYLVNQGYRIRERNYANRGGLRLGEIDIVAENKREIIFVEVKAAFLMVGSENRLPEWQITRSKLRKMEKAAAIYLKEKRLIEREYSFDAIAVTFRVDEEPEIRHLDHIFFS
ncbi:MAG: YraN family protein [Undibacterium sp.]